MSLFGVTSNAQFRAGVSSGQIWTSSTLPSGVFPLMMRTSAAPRSSMGISATAVIKGKVERRGGERHIKRNAVVVRRQCLEIGTDLVGSVAPAGNPVRADDDDVHLPVLHEMPARIVRDQRVGHAVPGELPRREACTLIAGTGFVDPHMHGKPRVMCRVHGGQGRTVIDEGQPARSCNASGC